MRDFLGALFNQETLWASTTQVLEPSPTQEAILPTYGTWSFWRCLSWLSSSSGSSSSLLSSFGPSGYLYLASSILFPLSSSLTPLFSPSQLKENGMAVLLSAMASVPVHDVFHLDLHIRVQLPNWLGRSSQCPISGIHRLYQYSILFFHLLKVQVLIFFFSLLSYL